MALHGVTGALRGGAATFGGIVQAPNAQAWDEVEGAWGDADAVLSEDKPVYFVGNEFYQEGIGTILNGVPVAASLVRTGLTITGKGRKGEWTVDPTVVKEVTYIWPSIRGTVGDVVYIRLGASDAPEDPVRWDVERPFRIGIDRVLDYVISGVFIAVSFRSSGASPWELLSYDLDINPVGQ